MTGLSNISNTATQKVYLFSIDLEDIRFRMDDGLKYAERLPQMTAEYLKFLDAKRVKTTFFVVGDVALKYPEVIKEIASRGHEIGCHSAKHIPIDHQSPKEFKEDLEENMKALHDAGVKNIHGFRAPVFSLTAKTEWAYKILSELGFEYSSSVLPARNPLYGWPEFGQEVFYRAEKIWEIPMSVYRSSLISFPAAGGIYFRTLPFFITRSLIRKAWKKGQPVLGYFHPYDIDKDQERFMHPGINNSRLYNFLMYYNRKKVFRRLDSVTKEGGQIMPYIEYVRSLPKE